jgi:coenzyme F420-reducing hydrogenase delta subunit/ferredoxin
MQYPSNVRIIRVPCSGKVDITYLLRAFEAGADGVIVAGCLEGGCHFVEGNYHAKDRVNFARTLLGAVGINPDRLEMFNLSSSMAPTFVHVVNEMTTRVGNLGPALPKKVSFTDRLGLTKREFLYQMLKNLALRSPEKPIVVPDKLKEFGRIEYDLTKCIGCKKCEEVCKEKAVDFLREFDLPTILKKDWTKTDCDESKATKRRLLYASISRLAVKTPNKSIQVPQGLDEFSKMCYAPKKCVVCEKCIEVCPEKAITLVKEIDLQTILGTV